MKPTFLKTIWAALCVLVAIGLYGCSGQKDGKSGSELAASAPQTSASVIPNASGTQWEYIVVSYGKTLFGAPDKTLAYRGLGLPEGQEGTTLQKSLDILGRFGWETVAFVGQIGGDQQVVLKRKFDRSRAADESQAIAKNKEVYLKDLADILERQERRAQSEAKAAETSGGDGKLIELDAAERARVVRERMTKLQETAKAAIAQSELAQIGVFSYSPITNYSVDLTITVEVDLTAQFLKNGNSYSQKEVNDYLNKLSGKVRGINIPIDGQGDITWKLNGFLTHHGKKDQVSTASARYIGVLKSWY